MKIAMLVNNMDVSGGYHKLVIRLAQQLGEKGHEVTTYTPTVDREACFPNDIGSIDIVSLTPTERSSSQNRQFKILARKVSYDSDAVIIHDPLSLPAIAHIKTQLKTRIVWMLNNQFDPDDLGIGSSAAKELSKLIRGKKTFRALRTYWLVQRGLAKVTDFATWDEFNKNMIKKYLSKDATIVYAGADLDRFKKSISKQRFSKKTSYSFLSVGILFPHRRYEDIVEAAVVLKEHGLDFKIVIIGRHDLHKEYSSQVEELVLDKGVTDQVIFENYVTDDDMLSFYKDSDAFIFVNDGYTWGIAVFEAVAAKLPVIITNNIGAADLIKNHKNGWVIEPRSPKEIAKAIEDIINNPQEAKLLADKAYNELVDFLSWSSYADRMIEVIEQ